MGVSVLYIFFPMKFNLVVLAFCLTLASCYQQYCKCQCGTELSVTPIDKCGLCTKEWCLEKNAKLCPAETVPDDILISCFQVESAKEKVIVGFFVFCVVGLLLRSLFPA